MRSSIPVACAVRAAASIIGIAVALALTVAPARAWETMCNAAIPATMVDSVDSGTAYPGMQFRFKITTTARILGTLVPSGTIGYGYVREVSGASNRNRNGSLILEMRELIYRNRLIQVMADPRDSSTWAPAMTLTERATNYIPIAGLIRTAVNEVRDGKNIRIGPGFVFHVIGLGDPRKTRPCRKVGR
jgi:hypothetical protein